MHQFKPVDLQQYYTARHPRRSADISTEILHEAGGNSDLKKKLKAMMEKIAPDLHAALLGYERKMSVCGFAAGILVELLREALPEHRVRIGFGKQSNRGMQHYWAEVDDVFIETTHGQFDCRNQRKVLIGDLPDLSMLGIKRFDPQGDVDDQRQNFHAALLDSFMTNPNGVRVPQYVSGMSPEEEYTREIIQGLRKNLGLIHPEFKNEES